MTDFAALLAADGVVEDVEIGSRLGVMAFHGGDLEVHTDLIADAVAGATGASRYAVRQPTGMRRHFPSTTVRAECSPALRRFLAHVEVVLTIHGYGRRSMFRTLLVGGSNRALAGVVAGHLRHELPGYEVIDDLDAIPPGLRGLHPDNPVNVPPGGGVQLELPPRVRGNGPFWNPWTGGFPSPHTACLIDGLTRAVLEWDPCDGQGARRSSSQDPSTRR